MKITEAITFLKQAENRAEKKSQKKHYNTFIAILTDLRTKDLAENQFLSIEKQLDNLQLNSKFTLKQLKRNFSKLQEFLKIKFSLTEEGHFTSLGIVLGMCFGLAFGAVIDKYIGSSIGMTVGMLIGIVIGKSMDSKAEIHGRALKTTLQ
jgi:F0F1-type ATP synthase assembly protein I